MSDDIKVMMLFKGLIPDERLQITIELSEHGESVVALEMLCVQICDGEIPLSTELFLKIKKLCDDAGVTADYYEDLRPQVRS